MSKKNKWIIAISVFVVVVLAAVLLVFMLGDIAPKAGSGEGGTSQEQSGNVENFEESTPDNSATGTTTDVPDNTTEATDAATTKPSTTEPSNKKPATDTDVNVDVDVDIEVGDEEEEESGNSGVINFEDLLAAAGK